MIDHALQSYEERTFGVFMMYVCQSGYEFDGYDQSDILEIQCNLYTGQWDAVTASCVGMLCFDYIITYSFDVMITV